MQLDLALMHHGVIVDDDDGQVPGLVQLTQRKEYVMPVLKSGSSADGIPVQDNEVKASGKSAYLTMDGMHAILGEPAIDLI